MSAPDRRRAGASAATLPRLAFPAWCKRYLVQSIDQWAGLPLELEGFQREVVKEALATDEAAG